MDNTDLQKFIEETGLNAEILSMKGFVRTVAEAAKELGIPAEQFIKSVVFTNPEEDLILAIVKGTDRASAKRITKAIGIETPRLATPEEALKLTGYKVGGTPPISIPNARVLIDPNVMEIDTVVGGGGSSQHLLRISPKEIVKCTQGKIVRIRK